jgi:hypothetical protein
MRAPSSPGLRRPGGQGVSDPPYESSYILPYDSNRGIWRPPTDFAIVLTPRDPLTLRTPAWHFRCGTSAPSATAAAAAGVAAAAVPGTAEYGAAALELLMAAPPE